MSGLNGSSDLAQDGARCCSKGSAVHTWIVRKFPDYAGGASRGAASAREASEESEAGSA